jgi:manganese/zinc/iron transport system substrate-binding protein
MWKLCSAEVGKALQKADPANAASYGAATEAYLAKIEETHLWALARTKELPVEKRKVVTSHDAYNYFARAYGFEVKGLQGISTVTKPGLQTIRAAVKYIRENGISVIFAETSVPRAAVEKVAEEAGCQIYEHELYSDALGKPGSQAESFLGMFRFNLEAILAALGKDGNKSK